MLLKIKVGCLLLMIENIYFLTSIKIIELKFLSKQKLVY